MSLKTFAILTLWFCEAWLYYVQFVYTLYHCCYSEQTPTAKKKDSKDIWDEQEVPEGANAEDEFDPRPAPEYVPIQ